VGSGVVALRFGTQVNDALFTPVVNRLDGEQLGQFIEGQVFGDELAKILKDTVDDAAQGSSKPALDSNQPASGHWISPPAATATVDIFARDAMPITGDDIRVGISANMNLTADAALGKLVLVTLRDLASLRPAHIRLRGYHNRRP